MLFNQFPKVVLFVAVFTVILFSCSKEDEPVKAYEYESANYDIGHLIIKVSGSSAIVDSIKYTNVTRGVTNDIDVGKFTYYSSSNSSVLSMPLANGHVGDQLQCCVHLNSPTNIGVEFEFKSADSVQTTSTTSNIHCEPGVY